MKYRQIEDLTRKLGTFIAISRTRRKFLMVELFEIKGKLTLFSAWLRVATAFMANTKIRVPISETATQRCS